MKKFITVILVLMMICLCASCGSAPSGEQASTPPVVDTPVSDDPGKVHCVITDYYNKDGAFSDLGIALDEVDSEKSLRVYEGDILVIGDLKYQVAAEDLMLVFYTQPSLEEVITWWTEYVQIWQASGIVIAVK